MNTFNGEKGTCHTRAAWNKDKASGSPIDYIMCSRSLRSDAGVFGQRVGKSDHFWVWGAIRNSEPMSLHANSHKVSLRGWTLKGESEQAAYSYGVLRNLQINDSVTAVSAHNWILDHKPHVE
eukprot:3624286-Karenia_brevis.AAC.1